MFGVLTILLIAGGFAAYEYIKAQSGQNSVSVGPPNPGSPQSPHIQSKFDGITTPVRGVLATGLGTTASPAAPGSLNIASNMPLDIQSTFGSKFDVSAAPPPDAPVAGTDVIIEDGIQRFAQAIGHAEGYGVPGAIPTRTNNPGDLKLGDQGQGMINGKTVFSSALEGWLHLRAQIRLMWLDQSDYYGPDDTFKDISETWTAGNNSEEWLATVSFDLGVSATTTLRAYLTGGTARG